MIVVKVKQNEKGIQNVSVEGHAMYANAGKDIVCAGVSTMLITTVNALLKFDELCITYKQADGLVEVNVVKTNDIVNLLLNNLIDLLKELKNEYPKNIKIEEVSL